MKMGRRYYVRSGEGTPEYDYDTRIPFRFEGVDLTNGTIFFVDGIDDLENNTIVIKCRNCREEYSWDKKIVMEDQWTSGLCKECLLNEQKTSNSQDKIEYVRRILVIRDHTDNLVIPPKDQEWEIKFKNRVVKKCSREEVIAHYCYTEDQIKENFVKLKFILEEKWILIKFEESQIKDSNFEVCLVDQNSIFFKIIENMKVEKQIDRMISYENWKANNFEIFLILESECFEKTNQQVLDFLINKYPDSRSPRGSLWTLQGVRLLREYMNQIPKDFSREWEKWENTIRMMLRIRKILIPERLIIFKNNTLKQFSYQEIDALIKLDDKYFLIDAKYKGGNVNPEKIQIYMKALEKLSFKVIAALIITAEEGIVKRLDDKIYIIPSMWFSTIYDGKQEEKMLFRIKRAIDIADGNFP